MTVPEVTKKTPRCSWCGRDAVIPIHNSKRELTGYFCTWCGHEE